MVSFECNAIYVEDVEDRSNINRGCNDIRKSFGKLRLTLCILKIIMISDVSDINSITDLRCTCSISDISDML